MVIKKNAMELEKLLLIIVIFLWTFLFFGSVSWDLHSIYENTIELAKKQALSAFEKDLSYRLWNAMVGGVYVSTDKVKPNPYLSFLPNRDITTKEGKGLTLVNPSYMTRLVYNLAEKRYGLLAHLTSLKPLNPENKPDFWEKEVLLSFEKGAKEAYLLTNIKGKQYLRYMRPFIVEKPCLKCHGSQGYKIGDVRGGISIYVPFDRYLEGYMLHRKRSLLIHGIIFIFGVICIFIGAYFIKRNKSELLKSEERLRTLMDAMPDIVCFKDGEGRWLEANRFDLQLFGLEGVDYRGKKDSELANYSEFYKDAFLACEKTDEIAWKKGEISRGDEAIALPNGEYKIFDVIKVPLFNEDGTRKGLVVVGRDVTELRNAQKKLLKLSKLKDLILYFAIDFINFQSDDLCQFINDSLERVGKYLEVDRAYFLRFYEDLNQLYLRNEWSSNQKNARINKVTIITIDEFLYWINRYNNEGYVLISDVNKITEDSLKRFLIDANCKSFLMVPVMNEQKYIGAICLETVDFTKYWEKDCINVLKVLAEIYANAIIRLSMLEQLEQSERKYRELFERVPTGLYQNIPGPDGRFIMVNKAMVEMFGYDNEDEMLNIKVADLYPDPTQRLVFSQYLSQKGIVKNYEMQLKKKDGTLFWVAITARVIRDLEHNIYFEGAVQDITERKEAEKETAKLQLQLQQAQKLESIGRLAGGVAHDLNNLLVPILGYNELLLTRLDNDSLEYQYVKRVTEATERARSIVKQLLAFSRKDVFDIAPINLNKLIINFEKLLRGTIRENVEIVLKLAPDLPTVKADKGKIEQVILNLAINAQDAMPEGGTLTIETFVRDLDEEYASRHRGVIPGKYVCMVISDTGHGMDEETKKNIFEPFFTTKPKEIGTGLGLATVYGIIKQHKGNIWVYSEVGKGTTFKIYLPVSGEKEYHKSRIEFSDEELKGTETILLVEDNYEVRKLVKDILSEYGYTVIEAKGPKEALNASKLIENIDGVIDLLLTDVIMPEMNGKELYETLIKTYPKLKVVYMSGYTENVIGDHGVLKKGTNFISKPFSKYDLLKTVREAIVKDKD